MSTQSPIIDLPLGSPNIIQFKHSMLFTLMVFVSGIFGVNKITCPICNCNDNVINTRYTREHTCEFDCPCDDHFGCSDEESNCQVCWRYNWYCCKSCGNIFQYSHDYCYITIEEHIFDGKIIIGQPAIPAWDRSISDKITKVLCSCAEKSINLKDDNVIVNKQQRPYSFDCPKSITIDGLCNRHKYDN
jgi:hypothetical protein